MLCNSIFSTVFKSNIDTASLIIPSPSKIECNFGVLLSFTRAKAQTRSEEDKIAPKDKYSFEPHSRSKVEWSINSHLSIAYAIDAIKTKQIKVPRIPSKIIGPIFLKNRLRFRL